MQVGNIVSLENFEDINENYLLRAPKKGKLRRGPNWTAFNRENLGSIPRRTEKVLLEDRNKERLGFLTQLERFSIRPQSIKYNYPGPGTYKLHKNFDFTTTSSSFYSSKGFGNGFVSETDRFDNPKEFYEKFYPGPGQYKTDETMSLNSTMSKTLTYKSLYDKSQCKSLKVKTEGPGPGFYDPKPVSPSKIDGEYTVFKSNVRRFKKDDNSVSLPGPGNYFQDNDYLKYKQDTKNMNNDKFHTTSHFFKMPLPKKQNLLEKYIESQKKKKRKTLKQQVLLQCN